METFSLEYISGSCNSTPSAVAWSEHQRILFAINNGVAILKTDLNHGNPGRIERISCPHKSRVNVVKCIETGSKVDSKSFVSASVDGTIIVWIVDSDGDVVSLDYLTEHEDSVTELATCNIELNDGTSVSLIASLSLNCLKLWRKKDGDEKYTCVSSQCSEVDLGATGLAFSQLPSGGNETILLASPRKFTNILLTAYTFEGDSVSSKEVACLSGHTNWINAITFSLSSDKESLLLATASHDCSVRVWNIKATKGERQQEIRARESVFMVNSNEYIVNLSSILYGHDNWVYMAQWKYFQNEVNEEDKVKLLTISADKNVLIWRFDHGLCTWVEQYRLGDVGGNLASFVGGTFSPDGQSIICYDVLGSFHVWRYQQSNDSWIRIALPNGHHEEVNDICWDPNGQFLISASSDKTCRLHAPWKKNTTNWYELARPQTHGHAIFCVTVLPELRLISGAAEKELRYFIASKRFIQNFRQLSVPVLAIDETKYAHNNAVLASLELSNKATDIIEDINVESQNLDVAQEDIDLPSEGDLYQTTLWPEYQKLYFHPNELACVTSNIDGSLIASSCKATSVKEASIVIWTTKKWDSVERIQELVFHQLTVMQLSFSPDQKYLLSVSRDRTWSLFKINSDNLFDLTAFSPKTNAIHKRQLQCCSWSHDSKYFVTGSRDGKVVIWSTRNIVDGETILPDCATPLNGVASEFTITMNDDVRSVSFGPGFIGGEGGDATAPAQYVIAIGCGSGRIDIHLWNGAECRKWFSIQDQFAHSDAITKVQFSPVYGSVNGWKIFRLASCGVDRVVKIYNINIGNV